MLAFLEILIICAVLGVFATSLAWVFFWVVGILDVPEGVSRMLGIGAPIRVVNQYQLTVSDVANMLTRGIGNQITVGSQGYRLEVAPRTTGSATRGDSNSGLVTPTNYLSASQRAQAVGDYASACN
jgi:hypothetical protein